MVGVVEGNKQTLRLNHIQDLPTSARTHPNRKSDDDERKYTLLFEPFEPFAVIHPFSPLNTSSTTANAHAPANQPQLGNVSSSIEAYVSRIAAR